MLSRLARLRIITEEQATHPRRLEVRRPRGRPRSPVQPPRPCDPRRARDGRRRARTGSHGAPGPPRVQAMTPCSQASTRFRRRPARPPPQRGGDGRLNPRAWPARRGCSPSAASPAPVRSTTAPAGASINHATVAMPGGKGSTPKGTACSTGPRLKKASTTGIAPSLGGRRCSRSATPTARRGTSTNAARRMVHAPRLNGPLDPCQRRREQGLREPPARLGTHRNHEAEQDCREPASPTSAIPTQADESETGETREQGRM